MNAPSERRQEHFPPSGHSGMIRLVLRGARRLVPRAVAVRMLLLLACTAQLAAVRPAFAHAHLVKSSPLAGAHLSTSPRLIQLWFSEQPEIALTRITLTSSEGLAITLGGATAAPDAALSVVASIDGPLPAGDYTVRWSTVAADGHPSHGVFRFSMTADNATVTSGAATTGVAGSRVAGAPSGSTTVPGRDSATDSTQDRMGVESPLYVIIRWISFTSLIIIIGVVSFALVVLPRTESGATQRALSDATIPHLAALGLACGVILVADTILRIFAEHAVVGAGMKVTMYDLVWHTGWGTAWILQLTAAITACAGFAIARARAGNDGRRSIQLGWVVAAISAIVLAATPALSGHAAAAPNLRWLAISADSLHVLAAGGWLGSLFAMVAVGVPVALSLSAERNLPAASLVAELVNAFSPTALAFAAIVVITGVTSAWLRLQSVSALWRSTYGRVLLVKLVFVALVLAGGAFNWLRMRGALRDSVAGQDATHRFHRSGMFELVAGALVIAVTAILVATQTPIL